MIYTKDVADNVRNTLRDYLAGPKSFSDDELVLYINSAIRWVVGADSSANPTTKSIPLVEGIHQKIPADGVRLLEFWTNDIPAKRERINGRTYSGTDAIKSISHAELRHCMPSWNGSRKYDIVVNVVFNKEDPTHFVVSPPNSGNGSIIVTYAALPPNVSAIAAEEGISLPAIYQGAIVHYVLFKALARDGEDQSNASRAEYHYGKAREGLQAKVSADHTTTPALEGSQ